MPLHRRDPQGRKTREWDPFKVMIAIIVFGSALYLAWFSYDNRQKTECQARYNREVARVTETRAKIFDDERKANVDFFLAIARAGNNRDEVRKVFQAYIDQVKEFEKRRQQNPIPHLSERTCS